MIGLIDIIGECYMLQACLIAGGFDGSDNDKRDLPGIAPGTRRDRIDRFRAVRDRALLLQEIGYLPPGLGAALNGSTRRVRRHFLRVWHAFTRNARDNVDHLSTGVFRHFLETQGDQL